MGFFWDLFDKGTRFFQVIYLSILIRSRSI